MKTKLLKTHQIDLWLPEQGVHRWRKFIGEPNTRSNNKIYRKTAAVLAIPNILSVLNTLRGKLLCKDFTAFDTTSD